MTHETLTYIAAAMFAALAIILTTAILTDEKHYRNLPWLWGRKAYRAWKMAYNGKMYALPNECEDYEHFVGFGVEWWGYVHIENSNLVCLLYKNEIETDDKIRVAIFDTEMGNGVFDKGNLLFTHFWEKHGDLLVEKALPLIIENYKWGENETEWE